MSRPGSDTGGRPSGQFGPDFYRRLPVGGQLGHLEYLVKREDLELYRSAVGYPDAGFPSLALAEGRQVLAGKYGTMPLTGVRYQEWYYRPPFLERRVQVSGWIREKYRLHGRDWLVVGTFAVDEIGTEVLRSQHTFLVGEEDVGDEDPRTEVAESWPTVDSGKALAVLEKQLVAEDLEVFRTLSRRLAPACEGAVDEPAAARLMSFAYLHQLMASSYGIDFRQGGQLDVRFLKPLRPGGKFTAHGSIFREKPEAHRTVQYLRVWLEAQDETPVAFGQAKVTVPSPLT